MKMKIALVVATVILAACSSQARYQFFKEGATPAERIDAVSECEYQVRLNKTPADERRELIGLCMQGKGFRLKRID